MYNKILVPLDGSPVAECVIPHVEALAKSPEREVQLITIIEPFEMPTRGKIALSDDDIKQANAEMKQEAHRYLDQVSQKLIRSGIKVHPIVLVGKPAETLVEYVNDNDIDILIMATHGRSGISKLFWGSVAEKVMRSINIPILLIKTKSCEGGQAD
jgi:nucleotide-binding universal stress UspA family protein